MFIAGKRVSLFFVGCWEVREADRSEIKAVELDLLSSINCEL